MVIKVVHAPQLPRRTENDVIRVAVVLSWVFRGKFTLVGILAVCHINM
jgi:hypothetical protein